PLGVVLEALAASAAERVVEDEVEGPEVGELVALDLAAHDPLEMLCNARNRQFSPDQIVSVIAKDEHAHVARIALVTRSRVSDLMEPDPSHGSSSPCTMQRLSA